jgi:hypothetical protein
MKYYGWAMVIMLMLVLVADASYGMVCPCPHPPFTYCVCCPPPCPVVDTGCAFRENVLFAAEKNNHRYWQAWLTPLTQMLITVGKTKEVPSFEDGWHMQPHAIAKGSHSVIMLPEDAMLTVAAKDNLTDASQQLSSVLFAEKNSSADQLLTKIQAWDAHISVQAMGLLAANQALLHYMVTRTNPGQPWALLEAHLHKLQQLLATPPRASHLYSLVAWWRFNHEVRRSYHKQWMLMLHQWNWWGELTAWQQITAAKKQTP